MHVPVHSYIIIYTVTCVNIAPLGVVDRHHDLHMLQEVDHILLCLATVRPEGDLYLVASCENSVFVEVDNVMVVINIDHMIAFQYKPNCGVAIKFMQIYCNKIVIEERKTFTPRQQF